MVAGLSGKTALVSGAGTGIGLATARRLAAEGVKVVAGIAMAGQAAALDDLDHLVLDVREEADWQRAIAHVEAAHGGLDLLVNNAGIHRLGSAEATDKALFDEVMGVNLWGSFLGCREAIPAMRRRGGGAIVNLASINALKGVPGMLAYNTSKGAIRSMTMSLALEVICDGIRVNCVCPGAVETPIIEGILAQSADAAAMRAAIAARHPIGRMAAPEEVAGVIAFLLSDEASYMTGLAIPVDGGRSVI